MATYEYRCSQHGPFDIERPMGHAEGEVPCPTCEESAIRLYSPPRTSLVSRPAMAAINHSEKSGSEPEVVTSLPRRPAQRRTPMAPPTPALQRLPRP